MRVSIITIGLLLISVAANAAPVDSIVRVLRLSSQELLLVTTGESVRYREDLSAPPNQIRIELKGARPADSIRTVTFEQGSAFTSLFIQNKAGGALAIIESNRQQGHVVALLPFSNAIYVRMVNWNDLRDCYLGWGIAAWASGQYTQALRLWRTAATHGASEATLWLGIAEALQQHETPTLDYLEPLAQRTDVLPDVHAALARAYTARNEEQRSQRHTQIFTRAIGRAPHWPPVLTIESESSEGNTAPSLLDVFEQIQAPTAAQSSPSPIATEKPPADSDLFAQLRQFQQRNSQVTYTDERDMGSSPSGSWAILLAIGCALLLSGLVLLRSYRRWKSHRIEAMAQALARQQSPPAPPTPPASPPPTTFDELVRFESSLTSDKMQQQPPPPPEESEPALFDFDEETYRQHEARKAASPMSIDEQLLYQSEADLQLSQESPSAIAHELSEQERDLLRILERISKQYDDHSRDGART